MELDAWFPDLPGEGLYSLTARAVLSCLGAVGLAAPDVSRHAAGIRLVLPAYAGEFSVPWMGDDGRVRADRGFFAVFGEGRDGTAFLLRAGLTKDELRARGLIGFLSGCLAGKAGGFAVAGVGREAAGLSEGESMRLCRSFAGKLRTCLPTAAPGRALYEMDSRERGYMAAGLGLGEEASSAWAAGTGLCHLAQAVLRRAGKEGLAGKTLAVLGGGKDAEQSAERAARLGARVIRDARGDGGIPHAEVYFLWGSEAPLDEAGAARLTAVKPAGVFEGAPLACGPGTGERLERSGVLFVPAAAAMSCGMALPRDGRTEWEAERVLRRAAEALAERLWNACPGRIYRGAYQMAAETAAAEIIRRGV